MVAYRAFINQTFTFTITGTTTGSIWGTNIYTDDSDLATAAVHSGFVLFNETKVVVVQVLSGLSNYNGSTQNGVTSFTFFSWLGSFIFISASG